MEAASLSQVTLSFLALKYDSQSSYGRHFNIAREMIGHVPSSNTASDLSPKILHEYLSLG